MIVKGRVQNGVVVLDEDIRLPEGRKVTVFAPTEEAPIAETALVTDERRQALLDLIGICKTKNPPDDDEVERIIEEERMKKYG